MLEAEADNPSPSQLMACTFSSEPTNQSCDAASMSILYQPMTRSTQVIFYHCGPCPTQYCTDELFCFPLKVKYDQLSPDKPLKSYPINIPTLLRNCFHLFRNLSFHLTPKPAPIATQSPRPHPHPPYPQFQPVFETQPHLLNSSS